MTEEINKLSFIIKPFIGEDDFDEVENREEENPMNADESVKLFSLFFWSGLFPMEEVIKDRLVPKQQKEVDRRPCFSMVRKIFTEFI